MKLTTLEDYLVETLTDCFNEAFSDYIIRFEAKPDQLAARWKKGRVDFNLSGGAVADNALKGFIISGVDMWKGKLTTYNAATGVVPSARGQKITRKLYDFLLPKFVDRGIKHCTLEVIQRNDVAVHVYEKIGFRIDRALLCFAGKLDTKNINSAKGCTISKLDSPDWSIFDSFRDYDPSWENNNSAVEKAGDAFETFAIYDGELKGYIIKSTNSGFVTQFGVRKSDRNKGYGAALFKHIAKEDETLVITNVDSKSESTLNFLHSIGLKNSINQYEMRMDL